MRWQRVKRNPQGFTLLEIIIVLFLMTLILSLSAVFFANFIPSVKFNAAGREIPAMIRHARSLARMNMESKTFVIDLDKKTYGIEGLAANQIPPDYAIKIIDPSAGEINHGKYSIMFKPTGGTGGGTIILSMRKKVIFIDIDPITGAALNREEH